MEILPSKIQPEIKKSRVWTLSQSHVHSCEYDFVIKLKTGKVLGFDYIWFYFVYQNLQN